jgi:hypothetical protein
MKTTALTLLLLSSSLAHAGGFDFNLEVGETVCLKSEYGSKNLNAHPERKLKSLYFAVTKKEGRWHDQTIQYLSADVVGVDRKGRYYANTQPGCDLNPDGSLRCVVDCDGGSFDVLPLAEYAFLKVTPKTTFPLFRSGRVQYESKAFELDDSEENGSYVISPAPAETCAAALKNYKTVRVGGCF